MVRALGYKVFPLGETIMVKHGALSKSHVYKLLRSRSEEHTSELQSLRHLVCRLPLEKKNTNLSKQHQITKIKSHIQTQTQNTSQYFTNHHIKKQQNKIKHDVNITQTQT